MKRIEIVQVGLGLIGGTVAEQIVEGHNAWAGQGLDVGVSAILTTTGAIKSGDRPFSGQQLQQIVDQRRRGVKLADIAADLGVPDLPASEFDLSRLGLARPIVMDAATGAKSARIGAAALAAGGGVVYSNKAPMSQPLADSAAAALWAGAAKGTVRYETTCGAGLPVISTIKTLQATNDTITGVVGCLSGTLGAIFSDVAAGKSLSVAVRAAKDAGYTEPDPRDDLSGLDVARKALILARTIGRTVDLADIAVESLVPESLADCSVQTFMERIADHDAELAERQARAARDGQTLKYVANVPANGKITVGIEAVSVTTVLGALQGPENIISIRTSRYDRYPLTISGPGAGAAVTAAGMIADMLELARAG